jgi:hypothetical protein
MALFYVIGTDGYASELCQSVGTEPLCASDGPTGNFDDFAFTPEIVTGLSPNVVDWTGNTKITVTGTLLEKRQERLG